MKKLAVGIVIAIIYVNNDIVVLQFVMFCSIIKLVYAFVYAC